MTVGRFPCPPHELHLEHTLISGQTFRWHLDADGWWACLLTTEEGPMLIRLRREAGSICYEATDPNAAAVIHDYFRLEVNLASLTGAFLAADRRIGAALARFPGLRVLRQDPVENLFSFICTAAAPLHRIRRSVLGLCRSYGEVSVEVGGVSHFSFPTVEALAGASVEDMRELGLGYRGRYIQGAARRVLEYGGAEWLRGLRQRSYAEAKAALRTLPGVGEKIADCVCLFSLDKDGAIPVDTHIRRIALRDYIEAPAASSLTPTAYAQIGDGLRARFGPMAGWAQQYLFFHDLFGRGAWDAYTALWQPKEPPRANGGEAQ